jgi:hypothetical protein
VGRRDVNRGHAKTKETECIRGFGEPDGKTGGNDGIGCVGEVICIYPYVPLKSKYKSTRANISTTKSDNHIKGTSKHTMRGFLVCLGKKSNPTQEVPYEKIIRRFGSSWQQQFGWDRGRAREEDIQEATPE